MSKRALCSLKPLLSLMLITWLLAGLVGCGGGGSSSNNLAGREQAPDPVVQDFPVFFVERPYAYNAAGDTVSASQRSLLQFEPGANLMMKARALPSAETKNLTELLLDLETGEDLGLYDIRDLAPDYSGERLLFSMRGPFVPGADEDEQPTWNLWQYDFVANELTRLIRSDTTAEAGHDREGQYLPDGKIVFTSNRQRASRAILLDEGRPQYAALDEDRAEESFVLHVMEDDGADIQQITFNQSHDRDPVVAPDGKLIFNRWDNYPRRDVVSLYRSNIDGTQLERYYGYHSQQSGRDGGDIVFSDPRVLADGTLLVVARDNNDASPGGDLIIIDADNYVDIQQPGFNNTSASIDGAQISPLAELVSLNDVSSRGRFSSVWPLDDGTGRYLVTWAQCRLIDEQGDIVACEGRLEDDDNPPVEAEPLYGLWILDVASDLQQPVLIPDEGTMISEAVVLAPRSNPFFMSETIDAETQSLIDANVGVLHIRSIYDFDGVDTAIPDLPTTANPVFTPAVDRAALFVRLVKPVSIPNRDVKAIPGTAFGRSQGELMREILGYAPVHPDGSVLVKVPANVSFSLSLLNARGERVSPIHRNWLQVRPGETKQCNGCHTASSELPHGRLDAEAPSINSGGPFSGIRDSLIIDPGQTIAEAVAVAGIASPTADLLFDDIWTDASQRTSDPSFAYRYQDLTTPAPVNSACLPTWQSNCRITPHYEDHIHPIWSVDRQTLDADGLTVQQDFTCVSCHSNVDADGLPRVPDAQLDLSAGASTNQPDHLKSYWELLFNDNEQILDNGVLVDRTEPAVDSDGNVIFEVDEDGELILDVDGNAIAVLRTFPVAASLRTAGARASTNFFARFQSGGTHAGYLSAAELKLIAEWIDIGGQYYNDPFVVPE